MSYVTVTDNVFGGHTNWQTVRATPGWEEFRENVENTYGGPYMTHVAMASNLLSREKTKLKKFYTHLATHYGIGNNGVDVFEALGILTNSRLNRKEKTQVIATYERALARRQHLMQPWVEWFDNYNQLYHSTNLRVGRAFTHYNNSSVRGLLMAQFPQSMAYIVDGTGHVVPCYDEVPFWDDATILGVAVEVRADTGFGIVHWWKAYYAESYTVKEGVHTTPPRPHSQNWFPRAEFRAKGMTEHNVGTNTGLVAMIEELRVDHSAWWNKNEYTMRVADIDLYMKYQTMTQSVFRSMPESTTKSVLFLALWHTGKKLAETIFSHHFLSFFAPFMRFMYPGTFIKRDMKYQVIMSIMGDMHIAYTQDATAWRTVFHDLRDLDRVRHVQQLLTYFIPMVSARNAARVVNSGEEGMGVCGKVWEWQETTQCATCRDGGEVCGREKVFFLKNHSRLVLKTRTRDVMWSPGERLRCGAVRRGR
jgi:hypothetical protein